MDRVWNTFSPKLVKVISQNKQDSLELVQDYDDNVDILRAGKDEYHAVLNLAGTAYSILRHTSREQLLKDMAILVPKLKPFTRVDPMDLDKNILNKICSCIWEKPSWSPAHVAVECQFQEAFTVQEIINHIDSQASDDGQTPLHVAVKKRSLSMVRILLDHNASVYVPDHNNRTVLHDVVETFKDEGDSKFLALLTGAAEEYELMQDLNEAFTPLIQAMKNKKFDAARIMVENNLLLDVPDEDGYPIHHALKHDNLLLAAEMFAKNRSHGFIRCKKNDATPLHWARSAEMIKMILNFEYELNVRSKTGHTAVHIMVHKERIGCLMELLAAGADPDIPDSKGNHPLHTAAKLNNVDAIRALIVFNADVNSTNDNGLTPRHAAAMHGIKGSAALQALHMVGAQRCKVQTASCMQGCLPWGTYDGDEVVYPHDPMKECDTVFKEATDRIVEGLFTECRQHRKNRVNAENDEEERCDKVLCLDGGGTRGSIQIQLLAAIERACDKKIIDCFDWIVGTSVGAMNTAMLATGDCMTEMRRNFFGSMSEVFAGTKPYRAETMESVLKRQFGEKKMMDIPKPKVMITGALSNRVPPALHFFRNYIPPSTSSSRIASYNGAYEKPPCPPNEELVWRAVRASTAAPTYFPPMDLFMDGALLSNNPAMDAMTEISEYYTERRLKGLPVRRIGMVLSLGTGNGPVPDMKNIHVRVPQAITDIFNVGTHLKAAAHLGEIMLSLVLDQQFRPVDRARAWCSDIGAAYFRLSPNLSMMTDIDEIDTSVILKLLWETQVYVYNNRDKIEQIGELLCLM